MANQSSAELDVRLVQLKGGKAGISGSEISRLKRASAGATVNWLIAAFDGKTLNRLPDDLAGRERLKTHTLDIS
jgi:hypothetical protein